MAGPVQQLQAAMRHGWQQKADITTMKKLLDRYPSLLNTLSTTGETLLFPAAAECDLDFTKWLIEEKVDVDQTSKYGHSAFYTACYAEDESRTDIIKLMIERNADVNGGAARATRGKTPLVCLLDRSNVDGAALLINAGADVNLCDKTGEMALDVAHKKNLTAFKEYFKNRFAPQEIIFFDPEDIECSPDAMNNVHSTQFTATLTIRKEYTPMQILATCKVPKITGKGEWNELEALKLIPAHENIVSFYGVCMMFRHGTKSSIAIVVSYIEGEPLDKYLMTLKSVNLSHISQIAFQMSSSINHIHENRFLHNSLNCEDFVIVFEDDAKEKLLVVLTDLTTTSKNKSLDESGRGSTSQWRWLAPEILDGNSPTSASDIYSFGIMMFELLATKKLPFKPLDFSQFQKEIHSVESAVELLSFPDACTDGRQKGVLGKPQRKGTWKELIRRCCMADQEKRISMKELRESLKAISGKQKASNKFIDFHIGKEDVSKSSEDPSGTTETDKSEAYKELESVNCCQITEKLKSGEAENIRVITASAKETPLFLAAKEGHLECVKVLVTYGSEVNKPDNNEQSPLFIAAQYNHAQICDHLLENGANMYQKEMWSTMSPFHAAACEGGKETCDAFIKHGVDVSSTTDLGQNAIDFAIEDLDRIRERLKKQREEAEQNEIKNDDEDEKDENDEEKVVKAEQFFQHLKKAFLSTMKAKFIDFESLKVQRKLSEGFFGVVFKADLVVGRSDIATIPVVCKAPKLGAGQDDWYELEVLQNVPNCPYVLRLLGICMSFPFEDSKSIATIVPLLPGGSLLSAVKKNDPMSPQNLVQFGLGMTLGVQWLHKNGYIHNDIALRNFLLSCDYKQGNQDAEFPTVVLADFGLTRPKTSRVEKDVPRPWRWCAPETIRENISNDQTDVWMLGIALWELLKCGNPFSWARGVKQLQKSYEAHPDENVLLVFPSACSKEAKELILTCCRVRSHERPAVSQIAERLENIADLDLGSGKDFDEGKSSTDGVDYNISEYMGVTRDELELEHGEQIQEEYTKVDYEDVGDDVDYQNDISSQYYSSELAEYTGADVIPGDSSLEFSEPVEYVDFEEN